MLLVRSEESVNNSTKILIVTLAAVMCVLTGLVAWRVADLKFHELDSRVVKIEDHLRPQYDIVMPSGIDAQAEPGQLGVIWWCGSRHGVKEPCFIVGIVPDKPQ